MANFTYINLLNKTLELYLKEEYEKGFNYIMENKDKVEGNRAQIYNFSYTLATKACFTEQAIELLKEAVLEKGYWYSYEYLLEDEDLDPLRVYEVFEEIKQICKKRESKAKKQAKPAKKVLIPENNKKEEKAPLLLDLHGNQGNIKIAEKYWKEAIKLNNMVGLIQSSQIVFSDAYAWNDIELGSKELKKHYEDLKSDYNIDENNIILGSFSAGASVILESINKDYINPKGLILVGPWLPEVDNYDVIYEKLKNKNIKLYIICGTKDQDCFKGCNKFVKKLDEHKIENFYDKIKGLNHDYPDNFKEKLKSGFDYIRER